MADYSFDSDNDSVIHQDSDDDEHDNNHRDDDDFDNDDDAIDIGFRRRHKYPTFGDNTTNRKSSRKRGKDEAIYGVFLEEEDTKYRRRGRDESVMATAPTFVAAKKADDVNENKISASSLNEDEQKTTIPASKTNDDSASNQETDGKQQHQPEKKESPNKEKHIDDEEAKAIIKEEEEARKKQKAADDYFLSLLNKGRGKADTTKSVPTQSSPSGFTRSTKTKMEASIITASTSHDDGESAPVGLGMPTSFGRQQPQPEKQQPIAMDPNLGRWEKHTKGIGSKLLAKMGYKGSGGLGSRRRIRKKETTEEKVTEKATTSTPQTKTTVDGSSAANDVVRKEIKTGISRPLEVVVRPQNMGLGFGSFKEASQLKANREIEAEVRGIELPEKDKKKKRNKRKHMDDDDEEEEDYSFGGGGGVTTKSSALPTTSELLEQNQWKRHKRAKNKKDKPVIIPYTELLKKQNADDSTTQDGPIIIDMTGGSRTTTRSTDGKVPLGEELLHNVSFLLNTYENKMHSSSHFVESTKRKIKSLKSDIDDIERRIGEGQERIAKLERVITIMQEVDDFTKQSNDDKAMRFDTNTMKRIKGWIQTLQKTFTEEERSSLKFWDVIIPSLLSPIVESRLDEWDPLGDSTASQKVIDFVMTIFSESSFLTGNDCDQGAIQTLRQSMFQDHLLPQIKNAFESTRWQPTLDVDVALDLYELVHSKVAAAMPKTNESKKMETDVEADEGNVFPSSNPDEESPRVTLQQIVEEELIHNVIYPKLVTSLNQWKPKILKDDNNKSGSGKTSQLEDRLDLWILPWVVHLDHHALLPNLMLSCKRKLKSALSHLQGRVVEDIDFIRICIDTLKPWRRALQAETLHNLTSESITPRLARFLSNTKIRSDPRKQDWLGLRLIFEMHGLGLLSDIEFLSLLEGEVMTLWASKVQKSLLEDSVALKDAAENYRQWKLHIMLNPDPDGISLGAISITHSLRLLQQDMYICRIFYSVLRMIQVADLSQKDILDDLRPPQTSFRVASARRFKEKQQLAQDELLRMESRGGRSEAEARIRLGQRTAHNTPTFREVVEEFARDRDVLFKPRMGNKSTMDGKQVFEFGKVQIYFDSDVVFAFRDANWHPISLDDLATIA